MSMYSMCCRVALLSHVSTELGMFVLNKEYYGNLVLPKAYPSLEVAGEEFLNFKLATLSKKSASAIKIYIVQLFIHHQLIIPLYSRASIYLLLLEH